MQHGTVELARRLLERPGMTIMTINGPWAGKPIPADIFTDAEKDWNLDRIWIRKK